MIADWRPSISPPLASADPALSKGWPARQAPRLARAATLGAITEQSRRTVVRAVKERARDFCTNPHELDHTSKLAPGRLVGFLLAIVKEPLPQRYFGFGGELPAINFRGAMLYARLARRVANVISKASEGVS